MASIPLAPWLLPAQRLQPRAQAWAPSVPVPSATSAPFCLSDHPTSSCLTWADQTLLVPCPEHALPQKRFFCRANTHRHLLGPHNCRFLGLLRPDPSSPVTNRQEDFGVERVPGQRVDRSVVATVGAGDFFGGCLGLAVAGDDDALLCAHHELGGLRVGAGESSCQQGGTPQCRGQWGSEGLCCPSRAGACCSQRLGRTEPWEPTMIRGI